MLNVAYIACIAIGLVATFLAACLWFKASEVKAGPRYQRTSEEPPSPVLVPEQQMLMQAVENYENAEAFKVSGSWNKGAAIFGIIAAIAGIGAALLKIAMDSN